MLFEIRYRLQRSGTWIFFILLFLMTFFAAVSDQVIIGSQVGNLFRNAPYIIANTMAIMSAFAMTITTAIMSTAVYRDFETNIHTMFYTLPVNKWDYLGGRFLGAFVINIIVFTGIPLGTMVGSTLAPVFGWIDPERIAPFNLWHYVHPFLLIVIPNILFSGAVFFGLATLTRKILYAYIGNIVLLVSYIAAIMSITDMENLKLAAIADPFSIVTVAQVTRYWTTIELNSMVIPLTTVVFFNRLLWLGIGLAVFSFVFYKFRFSQILESKAGKERSVSDDEKVTLSPIIVSPVANITFSTYQNFKLFFSFSGYYFQIIVKEIPFLIISLLGLALMLSGSVTINTMYGTGVYPVTGILTESLNSNFGLYIMIIITFYAGELVWREQNLKIAEITDALPVNTGITVLSKIFSLVMATALLMLVLMLTGMGIQAFNGYYHFEAGLYIRELFVHRLYAYTLFIILAVFIQTIVKDKYFGHFVMVLFYIVVFIVLDALGFEHNLYHFNGKPSYTYSDMNGFGHFLTGYNWFNAYWGIFAGLLLVLTFLFWQRGTENGLKQYLEIAKQRFSLPVRLITLVLIVAFGTTGGYIYYNTNILNKYRTAKDMEQLGVDYEKKYKKFQKIPQPKITGVKVNIDIFPYQLRLVSKGSMTLVNKSQKAIDSIHVNYNYDLIRKFVAVAGNPEPVFSDSLFGYYIYRLSSPMKPGDSIQLEYELVYQPKGFVNNSGETNLVYNGTFVNNTMICPRIGYNAEYELGDKNKRKKYHLPPRERMPRVNDSAGLQSTYLGTDGDWITFEATVSTSSDQIALAPGYLMNEWTEGDRRYRHFKMDSKILNFYSFISAKYEVKQVKWNDILLEVYYHKGHEYNVDRMLDAMKKSLDYYSANFSPYQHRQLRIIEFPRYDRFAQSFPNTIPYSESIGFIAKLDNDEKIDYVMYVTAHEIAHQWWAHQVIGGNTQGATLMSEALSQYSALMVMEKEYGKDKMRRFLKYESDRYLSGRRMEENKEMPLWLVENQGYIHYNKGSIVMYALRDYIGEKKLNHALAAYIKKTAFQNPPFTNSIEFLSFVKNATPDSLQYIITDMFENITLYSNKANKVTYCKMPDGKFKVHIEVESHKYRADSLGKEEEIDFFDDIDIGVAGKTEKNGKTCDKELFLKKFKIHKGLNFFELIINEEPVKAGIDIYNKLIDRDTDDNVKSALLTTG